jgi:S1-C subfamily serine protease
MKFWKRSLAILFLPCLMQGQQVAVDAAGRIGSAVLRRMGADCYAITANHIVEGIATITVTDDTNRHANAFVRRNYADADLAVLAIESPNRSVCDRASWPPTTADISNVLQNAPAGGKLVKIASAGSAVVEAPVGIVSYTTGQIIVSPSQTTIARGWSGSRQRCSSRGPH